MIANALCLLLQGISTGSAAQLPQTLGEITIQADRPGAAISPTFYGLMTEEINHAYDGGLYAELIQNRSFRNSQYGTPHWSAVGDCAISLDQTQTRDGKTIPSLKLELPTASRQESGVANDGYWGVPILPNATYRATVIAKASTPNMALKLSLETADGSHEIASGDTTSLGTDWTQCTVRLRTRDLTPSSQGRFTVSCGQAGTVWVCYASLFPPTYHRRPNGNRQDLMEKLAAMRPQFLRLPGGNYLEGDTVAERFDWKATLGDPSMRTGHQGPWGYRSSDGLGLLEFLEWCEDLRMQPVLAVYAGYSLRGEHVDPGPALQPFVQDALDEIEFVTGSTKTTWGARRGALGHAKPFPLTYVEIGNEDNFDRRGYNGRFKQFFDAIKAKYPSLQVIATAPVDGVQPDVIDDHYYRSASTMALDWRHYDRYSRTGPKIFVGEWASIEGRPTPTWQAALGDAAWLMGLERNSDLVVMESYAPLFVNVNRGAAQWPTNLIGFDNLKSFGSPSYYVQSLFGQNPGKQALPVQIEQHLPPPPPSDYRGKAGLGVYDTEAEYKDFSVVRNGQTLYKLPDTEPTAGWNLRQGDWNFHDGEVQSNGAIVARANVGDSDWQNYEIHVKARKISGREGFLVLFHFQDYRHYFEWNIGGWGNTQTRLEHMGAQGAMGPVSDFTVQTGRWYDLMLNVQQGHVKGYVDGRLVTDTDEDEPIPPIYAAATTTDSGDIVLKVANIGPVAAPLTISLQGLNGIDPHAEAWIMTGKPDDQNSIESPFTVAPKRADEAHASTSFRRMFPAYSVTLLRLRPQQK